MTRGGVSVVGGGGDGGVVVVVGHCWLFWLVWV